MERNRSVCLVLSWSCQRPSEGEEGATPKPGEVLAGRGDERGKLSVADRRFLDPGRGAERAPDADHGLADGGLSTRPDEAARAVLVGDGGEHLLEGGDGAAHHGRRFQRQRNSHNARYVH